MALTSEQKKNIAIGGVVGALALGLGWVIFGTRSATAAPTFQTPYRPPLPAHDQHRRKKRHHDDRGDRDDRHDREENGRGEYGRKKKKHKHKHRGRHGD